MNQPAVVSVNDDANAVVDWGAQTASFGARVARTRTGTLRLHVPDGQELCSAGLDLVDVHRIGRLMRQYGSMFELRVGTTVEVERLPDDPDARIRGLAGLFGVKESVIKALGGIPERGRFTDIAVGEPKASSVAVALHGAMADHADRAGIRTVSGGIVDGADFGLGWQLAWAVGLRGVPVSDERDYAAVATVAADDGMGARA